MELNQSMEPKIVSLVLNGQGGTSTVEFYLGPKRQRIANQPNVLKTLPIWLKGMALAKAKTEAIRLGLAKSHFVFSVTDNTESSISVKWTPA